MPHWPLRSKCDEVIAVRCTPPAATPAAALSTKSDPVARNVTDVDGTLPGEEERSTPTPPVPSLSARAPSTRTLRSVSFAEGPVTTPEPATVPIRRTDR